MLQMSVDYQIIKIKSNIAEGEGQLLVFESQKDIPFEIKRIYYIVGVPAGVTRGYHAHKELKQLIFCPYGEIEILLDNGKEKERILLNSPEIGVVITSPLWREMHWIKEDSVLAVAASEYYTESDYIRDYSDFKSFMKGK